MRHGLKALATAGLLCGAITTGDASPLTLNYFADALGGGVFKYEFALVLDNHDGTWAAGQEWSGIIFGDSPTFNGVDQFGSLVGWSGLTVPTPFTTFNIVLGAHNGPALKEIPGVGDVYWHPTAIGQTLAWTGTANVNLAQGQLLFTTWLGNDSTTVTSPGFNVMSNSTPWLANFEIANVCSPFPGGGSTGGCFPGPGPFPAPEPGTLALLALGLAGLAMTRHQTAQRSDGKQR